MALETPKAVPKAVKLPVAAAELSAAVPNLSPAAAKPSFAAALKAAKPPVLDENPFTWSGLSGQVRGKESARTLQ